MITFQKLTIKNFLSVGAVPQCVDLNTSDLTLILGENRDLGGETSGAKNGVGKSTILQALHYVLFNVSIGNTIRKDNLVNKTNEKSMLVSLSFSVDGINYEIKRGRKPNVLQFYIDNKQQEILDQSQGENRETQREIERILNLTPELFTQLTLLSTYTTPFLSLRSNEQRTIIESLLGISQLSERADIIKERIRITKDSITQEEYAIKATIEANRRINEQIDQLQRRQKLWQVNYEQEINKLVEEYTELSKINIDVELQNHKLLTIWLSKKEKLDRYNSLLARQIAWQSKRDNEIKLLKSQFDLLCNIDIDQELLSHELVTQHHQSVKNHGEYVKTFKRLEKEFSNHATTAQKLTTEVHELKEHRCYACGQEFHDEKHTEVLNNKIKLLSETEELYQLSYKEWATLRDNPVTVIDCPITHYKTVAEAHKHNSELQRLQQQISEKENEIDPYYDQLNENNVGDISPQPTTIYDTEEQAIKHSSRVETLYTQIEEKSKIIDPYTEQINEMTVNAVVELNYDNINELNRRHDHEKFLLDLLTNKDSFVRKRIVDQNLSYLNSRLQHYLDRLRLNHRVLFKNNLEVDISLYDREYDVGNLSRGEQGRVILSLSFAFRDLYENLFHKINGLYVDELIDNGLDTTGVECSISLFKEMSRNGRSVFLISHREDLVGRVNNTLKVVKESGFTSFEME